MSISDDEFKAWLRDDNQVRALLVESTCHNGTTTQLNYISNAVYASFPTDTVPNLQYDDLLYSFPRFKMSMPEAFGGQSQPSVGELQIDNSGGERDEWLDFAWNGWPTNIFIGSPSWSRDDFRQTLSNINVNFQSSGKLLILKLRDKQEMLNKELQTTLYTSGVLSGNPKPLCYGLVYFAEPMLTNSATHEYQLHDGAIEDILQVYEDCYPIPFTKDLTNGKFTLTNNPQGRVTCDVKGAKVGGVWLTKIADIVKDIITKAGLVSGDIDATSLSDFNTLCPETIGFYANSRMNCIEALDEIVKSVNGYWGFSRNGLFQLGRLNVISGTAVMELVEDDIQDRSSELEKVVEPVSGIRLGYKRYWSPAEYMAGAVTETDRADFPQAYRVVTAPGAGVTAQWPLATQPALIPTLLADASEAQDECDRRLTLFGVARKIFRLTAFSAPQQIQLGDEIKIYYPRYGLDSGVNAIVISIEESPTSNKINLRVWL